MSDRAGLIYWGVLALAAWLAALALGEYGRARFQAGQHAAGEARAQAEINAFRRESGRLAGLSAALDARIDALAHTRPALIERYTHEIRTTPLPADCVIDAGRLQHLNAAIGAANTAAESGRPVPPGPDADE